MATNMKSVGTIAGASSMSVNSHLVDSDSDEGILSGYSLPTLPELTQSSNGQQSSLTRSQYALVVFHGIADTYPTDSDIVCRYSLTDGVEAASGDRIVIFAVGWSSIKDYIVFDWAPMPEKGEKDLAVVFKAADLPKDTNEFYQVCYVSNEGAVCGASVPFQVRIPNNDELTFALEEDMVVVRSSTAVAQDKLLKAQLDQEALNKEKAELEKKLCSLKDKHASTLQKVDRLQETLSTSESLNEELERTNSEFRDINSQMLHTKEQLNEAQRMLDAAEQDKEHMQTKIEALIAAAEQYKLTITNYETTAKQSEDRLIQAVEQIESLRKAGKKSEQQMAATSRNLEEIELAKSSLATKNFSLDNELTVCKFNLNNTQLENLRLEAELEDLLKQRKELNEQLRNVSESEERHRTSVEQYSAGNGDNGRLIMENTKLRRMMDDLHLRISALEQEKFILEQVLGDTLDAQKHTVEEKQGCNSPDVESSLKAQVETLKQLLDNSLKENQLHSQENMALRLQNEIFETRLAQNCANSNEYVVVSKADDTVSTSQNRSVADQQNRTLKVENEKLAKQLDEYSKLLMEKDKELNNMNRGMEALKNEFSEAKKELNLEIDNLTSRNASLIEQERQSQELKDEMQRITFMNGELLAQNAALMERVHNSKDKLSKNTKIHLSQETGDSQSVDTSLEVENSRLRKQLEFARENLNKTLKQAGTVVYQLDEHNYCHKDNKLVLDGITTSFSGDSPRLPLTDKHDMLLQILDRLDSKIENEHHREHLVEPKLKQINQNVENVLSAVKQLASCSETTKKHEHCSRDANELEQRLMMAREEYEKLHATMVNYKTKYNIVKTKLQVKKHAIMYDNVSA